MRSLNYSIDALLAVGVDRLTITKSEVNMQIGDRVYRAELEPGDTIEIAASALCDVMFGEIPNPWPELQTCKIYKEPSCVQILKTVSTTNLEVLSPTIDTVDLIETSKS